MNLLVQGWYSMLGEGLRVALPKGARAIRVAYSSSDFLCGNYWRDTC
jgi:hypothetical protein